METGHAFRFRPLRLSYDLEEHDRELSLMLRDSLQWRYDPRCALEVHFAREMYHCVRRQERLKIVEERCADRALTCPDEEARSVAEQARIWSQCRARAKVELKALIDEHERVRAGAGDASAENGMNEPETHAGGKDAGAPGGARPGGTNEPDGRAEASRKHGRAAAAESGINEPEQPRRSLENG